MFNFSRKNLWNCGGVFDVEELQRRLKALDLQAQDSTLWNNKEKMQSLAREQTVLRKSIQELESIEAKIKEMDILLQLSIEEKDEQSFQEVENEIQNLKKEMEALFLKSLLSNKEDRLNAYISIHAGAGGTEACDWAEILLRMFLKYAEKQKFKTQILSITEGEGAGLKSVSFLIEGLYAYGYLNTEKGVHRLVRISPFDANSRRHTSFSAVDVWPEVDDSIEVEIKTEDLRIDTYRSSGAGGQHVNTTDSAVRITHKPTGIVVQCQNQRSQHANKDKALKMLKSALYEHELKKKNEEQKLLNAKKKANEWGSQIRSYVLHPYKMVKDHRTQYETGKTDQVLNGDIQIFIETRLRQKLSEKNIKF